VHNRSVELTTQAVVQAAQKLLARQPTGGARGVVSCLKVVNASSNLTQRSLPT